jgi:NAD(P)-dependent dehydrogenase (short-subunit alcohol dehydrogenase family)
MTTIPRPSSDVVTNLLKGSVAIVTGAARGIGFSTAALLAQHGARVVLVDLHEDALKTACATIGHGATYQACDVSDWNQQSALFEYVTKAIGAIHLLVCNAAVNPEIALLQTSDTEKHAQMASQVRYNYLADELDGQNKSGGQFQQPSTSVFDVNVNSVVFGLKLGIHYMKKAGGGRIVVVGSAGSYVPVSSQPLYTASKHAVLGLARSTAQISEVTEAGVSISWIAPWLTLTPMVEGLQATTHPNTLKSSPEDAAWAIIVAATAEQANGKGYWIQGQMISEVEGAYGELAGRLIVPENQF